MQKGRRRLKMRMFLQMIEIGHSIKTQLPENNIDSIFGI